MSDRDTAETLGRALLSDPHRNRGVAFTPQERHAYGIDGLLPAAVLTLEDQTRRAYLQYRRQSDDLARNTFLNALRDRNEVLYYKLLADHLAELLPVVYDPVVAQAIEHFSEEYQRPDGVYLSIGDIDGVERALRNFGLGAADVDLLVATDAEAILGIGDWGANGMAISTGKLAVYTAAAGIHPSRVIPVMIDVGTDNEALLNDPLYIGNRHSRARGEQYDRLIAAYVEAATRLFPDALLHFEDFGPGNARRILEQYRGDVRIFNDDMQGTGAISLAAWLSGTRVAEVPPAQQRIVVFGAGTAGVGIADRLAAAMVADGLDPAQATAQIWLVDKQGLLTDDLTGLRDFQRSYARPAAETDGWQRRADGGIGLAEVVARVHPTTLVGTSTVGGAFTEEIVRELAAGTPRPIVLPLSNPTERIEAHPVDVITWTEGRGLVATGTPWPDVTFNGVRYQIGQANNALLYPGLGLGVVVSRARHVTDDMLTAAAQAIADMVDTHGPGAGLLPRVDNLREMSARVAEAVVRTAIATGEAANEPADVVQAVHDAMWQPEYLDLGD
nr:NAD-dependent malic enzyme [Kibdelosporangium sp. MJ126-NF4]CEL14132.1 NAD-dependent malic enzyme [Kibdelosporangium sp. MJ126-NF4]CTQ88499.1 NAD-dependent malic enzyme (EC 1.1.1.38) [Kibdelosporangium sp. MJ126-NF4]